ncbi:hypothetical protein NDU88_002021 [Pleurodeles waltl]|uniref:Myb-like domain-containing protein n=1 Tax=Pleurodeles waltl TaxID=8319 RepID=A0AAV7W3E7_PLEWA|nr:hypothetical protein NDU88_002021 [Pleurodeles waltl]
MDHRCHNRPHEDDSRPGTSQDDPYRNQDIYRKKRKCRFSAEEQEILVKEVTEHQHQLFITSKLPISRREAIWQQIVDKINSVAEERRTVTECKKRWHDCKRRTKEKMARNRKAALQTGGGSPAHQEALDHMEEMVAAVIPEEIVTGIQGQDSADYHETTHMQGASDHRGEEMGGLGWITRKLKLKKWYHTKVKNDEEVGAMKNVSDLCISDIDMLHTAMDLCEGVDAHDDPILNLMGTGIALDGTCPSKFKPKSTFLPASHCDALDVVEREMTKQVKKLRYGVMNVKNNNLSGEQWQALQELKKDHTIVIRQSDKEGNVVIQDTINYVAEGVRQLSDIRCYEEVSWGDVR